MILGMSTAAYTLLHVLISLVGIGSGFVVLYGLLTNKRLDRWTVFFLATTVLTSLTGFAFPFHHLLPSHIFGVLSLVILAAVIPARYLFYLGGAWRLVYVAGSTTALYLNVFILVVQCFEKVPALNALAPTQKESPFLIVQFIVLVLFVALTILALKRFHIERSIEQEVKQRRAA